MVVAKSQPNENREVGLVKVGAGGTAQKDVKNEGCSGDVYENKGSSDKLSCMKVVFRQAF